MPPYAERKKKFIEKLKTNGKFDEYKKKRAKLEKERRARVKEAISKLSVAKQNQLILENRIKNRKGVQKFRMRQKEEKRLSELTGVSKIDIPQPQGTSSIPNNQEEHLLPPPTPNHLPLPTSSRHVTSNTKRSEALVSKSIDFPHSYNTPSALSKAATKTKSTLPSSPSRRKAVVANVLRSFDENDQRDIIGCKKSEKITANNALAASLVKDIRLFYERDDISRISPNVKDARKFVNPDTGMKEEKQVRHLMYKLSEVYDKFLDEVKDDCELRHPPVKLSKFCDLRPEHVFLMANTPRNVCFCLYHSNFIQCSTALHKYIPELPTYGPKLTELLVCDSPTRECYFKTCSKCNTAKIDQKIRDIAKKSSNKTKTVQWLKWVKDESANRFQNSMEKGPRKKLVDYFLSIYSKFLKHSYIKREQEKAFDTDRKRISSEQYADEALLQIDYAENFKCECQDEVQQAHYNQKQISLFTTALHHAKFTHPKVIASDNTHHTKETIVAHLYTIFKELPSTVKTVKVWSDGPSNQFKNKYIAAIIPHFERIFRKKIVWNYFATSHGKSCIDGIGAAVKNKVKGLVLSREAIVNNAKDFVVAFHLKQSKVGLSELTDASINKINAQLKVDDIFAKASNIQDISKFHRLEYLNNKVKGFVTSADGYVEKLGRVI